MHPVTLQRTQFLAGVEQDDVAVEHRVTRIDTGVEHGHTNVLTGGHAVDLVQLQDRHELLALRLAPLEALVETQNQILRDQLGIAEREDDPAVYRAQPPGL